MLVRNRISRIFYLHKFFDYPISLKLKTFTNMGLFRTIEAGCGYVWSVFFKKPETSLENFYINRFGKPLYRMFFEDYTEKVWGVHPSGGSRLGCTASKRTVGIRHTQRHAQKKFLQRKTSKRWKPRSSSNSFIPNSVPDNFGKLWPAKYLKKEARSSRKPRSKRFTSERNRVTSVIVETPSGERREVPCDYFLSSLPAKRPHTVYPGNRCTRRCETHCRRTALPRFYHGGTIDEKTIHKKSNQNKNFRRSYPRHMDLHTGTRCAGKPVCKYSTTGRPIW